MSSMLLRQFVRIQIATTAARDRVKEQAGQTTVEWLVIMVGITALATALTAANVWDGAAKAVAATFGKIVKSVFPG
jgi:hypothetical protein